MKVRSPDGKDDHRSRRSRRDEKDHPGRAGGGKERKSRDRSENKSRWRKDSERGKDKRKRSSPSKRRSRKPDQEAKEKPEKTEKDKEVKGDRERRRSRTKKDVEPDSKTAEVPPAAAAAGAEASLDKAATEAFVAAARRGAASGPILEARLEIGGSEITFQVSANTTVEELADLYSKWAAASKGARGS